MDVLGFFAFVYGAVVLAGRGLGWSSPTLDRVAPRRDIAGLPSWVTFGLLPFAAGGLLLLL